MTNDWVGKNKYREIQKYIFKHGGTEKIHEKYKNTFLKFTLKMIPTLCFQSVFVACVCK